MIIKSLKLTNYRNHKKLTLEPEANTNLILGDNGKGKTNILEAIHLLSTTKSFRARYDRDLISHDEKFAIIEAKLTLDSASETLLMQISKTPRADHTSTKKVKINNVARPLHNFTHYLKSVFFSPEDIDIITGSPSLRRRYADLVLFQVDDKYKKYHRSYLQAVRRRNKILEALHEQQNALDQLPYWNDKILEYGEYVQIKRSDLVNQLNLYFKSADNPHQKYSRDLQIAYKQNTLDTKRLLEYKDKEIIAKSTLIGPHRDDLVILQKNRDMAQFSSRGEQRTAMFLMKIAEYSYIQTQTEVKPVLLLDDIFSELDLEHRQAILSFINDKQTIITTASSLELPQGFVSKTFNLNN